VLRLVLWLLLWIVGLGCLAALALVVFRRRRLVSAVVPAPAPAAPLRTRREQAQDALTVLAAERTRSAAISVRGAIWRMVGASDGETLGDVLRRTDSRDVPMRDLLVALERSAFTYSADLPAAIEDSCAALTRYIDSAASS
jgi:hypothetical protein